MHIWKPSFKYLQSFKTIGWQLEELRLQGIYLLYTFVVLEFEKNRVKMQKSEKNHHISKHENNCLKYCPQSPEPDTIH